ncbi:MAG: hypothetical protein AAGD07_20000, partial [Planctomycetota bacterium]
RTDTRRVFPNTDRPQQRRRLCAGTNRFGGPPQASCLETRAEYRFLRMIGADVVGMSTVPETIVAVHCGLPVVGLSVITDMCLPDALKPADVAEIVATAGRAEPHLRTIVRGIAMEAGKVRVA